MERKAMAYQHQGLPLRLAEPLEETTGQLDGFTMAFTVDGLKSGMVLAGSRRSCLRHRATTSFTSAPSLVGIPSWKRKRFIGLSLSLETVFSIQLIDTDRK